MVPFDAPIFMLPLAGMLFLFGALVHQLAGIFWDDDEPVLWLGAFMGGMSLQIAAVVILIRA